MKCPICGKEMKSIIEEKNLPYFGKSVIFTFICENCGYKINDVFTVDFKEPRAYSLLVESEEDLFAKIIRGNNGTIEIKELGVKIEPGPRSQAFIKNVEGLLNDIENILLVQQRFVKGKKLSRIKKLLKKIKLMKEAKIKFKITVKDPTGISKILHPKKEKVKSRKLRKSEIKKLKASVIIFEKK